MAYSFDGVDQYSSATVSHSVTDFSIAFWIRTTESGEKMPFGAMAADDTEYAYILTNTPSANDTRVYVRKSGAADESIFYFTDATLYDGNQHSLIIWRQDGTLGAYLDGAVMSMTQTKAALSTETLVFDDWFSFGAHADGFFFCDCDIAEGAFYDEKLSVSSALELAAGFNPKMVRPHKLLDYWPMRGPVGSSAKIAPITGNTLVETGSPIATDHPPINDPSGQILQFPPVAAGSFQAAWATRQSQIIGAGVR